ncbi:shieldin complex subunit 2 isoform X2 [Mus pahari]|nr:shieldin complex subunit 2 isoform X2 [Mus pahari]XP_029397822.1 shieldin complex subunit 2 isoform X2 [Mus pahari]XP_029397823.1 shieldin complex subunit 2 isoform X2 [Mus pahari]XP_029397824.1 shieldin complex subunit 2 isoform X2 [Mus pahari]
MNRGSQVHIFLGAPVAPLKTTVPQGTASLRSTANAWEKVRLFYKQHSLYLKTGNQEFKNLEDCQVLEGLGPPGLLSGHLLTTPVSRSAQVDEDTKHCAPEAQSVKSQGNLSDMTSGQMCALEDGVQQLPEEEKYQKLQCKNKKIIDEQSKNQSDPCVWNFQKDLFGLDLKCAAELDLACHTEQMSTGTKPEPTGQHERQSQESFSSDTWYEPQSEGAVRKASDQRLSTDAEFLSVMTSSQWAFLAQGNDKGQDCINKRTVNMEAEPTGSQAVRRTEGDFSKPGGDFEEESENEQSQVYSLELFSPVCPDSESSHIHINPGKNLENTSSQELFSKAENLPSNELCSSHQSTAKRSWCSKDNSHHSTVLSEVCQVSKKPRMDSNIREAAKAVPQRILSEFKDSKKITLIKNCDSKNQKYNCLVMVLTPCHVKEITIKSGPNSGSKVPLATIIVIDQSEIKKRVVLWRTAAFGALTVFLGDIILLTDVVLHEDQWIGEMVLQSTFTSQLLHLGSYSYVQPEKYSNVIANVILQDLLAYVSSKHSYLKDLPPRQPQKMNTIEFVELEHLQPDTLVHAVLRVVDVTVLTEALYSYRGQKQRKVVLTVEQAQGQHYVLVLWGPGAAWHTQLQRKKDSIWEFKYLFVQRNSILENLELHTTLWTSCECLFDDETRAISFKTKFQKNTSSFVKISDLATHLEDKYSGVVLIKAKVSELAFAAAAQKIALDARSTLKSIFSSLPSVVYAGCAHCGSELETDENRIYRQCLSCLPFVGKKMFYRPALMTIVDGRYSTCVHVGSKMMEQILLNISPDCLNRVIVPSSEVTYGMVASDLLHSLLAVSAEPCVLKIQSLFELDENSYPLQQNFSLLDFCPDSCKLWSPGLSLRAEDTGGTPGKE